MDVLTLDGLMAIVKASIRNNIDIRQSRTEVLHNNDANSVILKFMMLSNAGALF